MSQTVIVTALRSHNLMVPSSLPLATTEPDGW